MKERQLLRQTNYVFIVIFTIEMVMKVIAKGLVIGRDTYLRNGWNVMDGFLVVVSIVDLIIMTHGSPAGSHLLEMLRALRLLRALRPLRGESSVMLCLSSD